MPRPLPRIATMMLAVTIALSACGSESDDSGDTDASTDVTTSPSSTAPTPSDDDTGDTDDETDDSAGPSTTTTTPSDATTPTTTASAGRTGVLAEGSVTTDAGVTSDWSLTATTSTLCFAADLSHPDSAVAEGIGNGVSACLEPDGGLDRLDGGLSVDVGTVDGDKTIGYLWGRVAPEVISLTIEHTDGSQTPIEILDGPTDVGLFVHVVEIASIPPVQDLDAVSGTQIEGSEPIRGFLRAGPTYPVVTPPPTPTSPDYPVS